MLTSWTTLCNPPSWEGSIKVSKGQVLVFWSHEKAKLWQQSTDPRKCSLSPVIILCFQLFTPPKNIYLAPGSRPETHAPFPIKRFFSISFREETTSLSLTWKEPCCLGTCWRYFLKMEKTSPLTNLLMHSGISPFKVLGLFKSKQQGWKNGSEVKHCSSRGP